MAVLRKLLPHCLRAMYERHSVNICMEKLFPKYFQDLWVDGCRILWKQQDDFTAKGQKTHLSLIVLNN